MVFPPPPFGKYIILRQRGILNMAKRKYVGSMSSGKRRRTQMQLDSAVGSSSPRYSPNTRAAMGTLLRRGAAQALRAGVARAVPYGGVLVGAYDAARRLRSVWRRSRHTQTNKYVKYHTVGKYAGKFKRKRVKRKLDPYLSRGMMNTHEVSGTVNDTDVVYITHSSYTGTLLIETIMHALLRKLFKKAGTHITSATEKIRGYNAGSSGGDSDGWKIVLVCINKENGTRTYYTYETATTESLYTITGSVINGVAANAILIMNQLKAIASNTATVDAVESLEIYAKDGNGIAPLGNFWHIVGDINLRTEVIHWCCKSELKVQNRTKGANSSTDAEDVNNNPLVGYHYQFRGGVPVSGTQNVFELEKVSESLGVFLTRGAQLDQTFREPPPPKVWANVQYGSKVKLEPGEIKKSTVYYKSADKLQYLLTNIGYAIGGTFGQSIKVKGKSAMLALEDLINVNATEKISCAYEVNRVIKVYSTSKYEQPAVGQLYQSTYNNTT